MGEHKDERDWLAARFEEQRSHLRAVAYRMLGSLSEADDAVQEAWLHLSRADTSAVANLGGWLTTVVARICLDQLRARQARREESLEVQVATNAEPVANRARGTDPEREVLLADAVGLALLVVLDTLTPAERLAFVLHDLFAVPFEEIAPIVGRSPTAARQLASRARRRVRQEQGHEEEQGQPQPQAEPQQTQGAATHPDAAGIRQRAVVSAFLAAARGGDFAALLTLLDPDVVYRADPAAVALGTPGEVRGAQEVGQQFAGRARVAQLALVDGAPGVVWAPGGQLRVVFGFTIQDGKIVAIDVLADPARLRQVDLALLPD